MIRGLAFGAAVGLALAGCVHAPQCPPLPRMARDAGLAVLNCHAGQGDKAAQLALGRRYEAGIGVRRNLKRAAALYAMASRFTPGTVYVYSPGFGNVGGQVIPVNIGSDQAGLPEAKYRLALLYLEGRGVRFSIRKGRKLLDQAAEQGHAPARAKLEELDRAPKA